MCSVPVTGITDCKYFFSKTKYFSVYQIFPAHLFPPRLAVSAGAGHGVRAAVAGARARVAAVRRHQPARVRQPELHAVVALKSACKYVYELDEIFLDFYVLSPLDISISGFKYFYRR